MSHFGSLSAVHLLCGAPSRMLHIDVLVLGVPGGVPGRPAHGYVEFWIRNKTQIFINQKKSVLGSAYGNQPYRSFHEQTARPRHSRNRFQRRSILPRASQSTAPCNICTGSKNDQFHGLLWRRSGRRRLVACRAANTCASNCWTLIPVDRLLITGGGQ